MGKYFTIDEFCRSITAKEHHIKNEPTPEVVEAHCLDYVASDDEIKKYIERLESWIRAFLPE